MVEFVVITKKRDNNLWKLFSDCEYCRRRGFYTAICRMEVDDDRVDSSPAHFPPGIVTVGYLLHSFDLRESSKVYSKHLYVVTPADEERVQRLGGG